MDQRNVIQRVGALIASGFLSLSLIMIWSSMAVVAAPDRISMHIPSAGAVSVQTTPTVDPTTTELQKEQLNQQVIKLKNDNSLSWINSIGAFIGNIVAPVGTIGTLVIAAIVAGLNYHQWRKNRKDERKKRVEERFYTVVAALGSDKPEPKVVAAITLRTFLQEGYEQFHQQIFDLAVANLRKDANPMAMKPLKQALIVVFRESYPFVRKNEKEKAKEKFDPQRLNASEIDLANAYLVGADLEDAWMPNVVLENAILTNANLRGANLTKAEFREADLTEEDLRGAILTGAALENIKAHKGVKLHGVRGKEINDLKLKFKEADFVTPPPDQLPAPLASTSGSSSATSS